MPERLTSGEEYTFAPENWDDHAQSDGCSWKDKPESSGNVAELIREYMEASDHTRVVLARFLASPDRTALRRFKRGDVFRIDRFSHEAVVRFTTESYVLGEPVNKDDPYNTSDFWGVVSALPSGRVVLMKYFTEYADAGFIFPGLIYRQNRIVPEVTIHQRYKTGFSNPDVLVRQKDLALYSAGKVVPEPEGEKARFRLPNFGTIFGRPAPQPA